MPKDRLRQIFDQELDDKTPKLGTELKEIHAMNTDINAILALVVSIIALGLALFEGIMQQRSYREQVYQGFANSWFELDKIFIEYPELRKYFYDGASLDKDNPDYNQVISIAELFDDAFTYSREQARVIPQPLEKTYINYRDKIEQSPAFLAYLEQYTFINGHEETQKGNGG
jgi:hypothetical protein